MSDHGSAKSPTGREIDGHRLAEFVYGVVTGLVAVAGIGDHPGGPLTTAGMVVAGAVAIWLAQGYAIMLGRRVTTGRRLTWPEIVETFAGSWPIVVAGALLAVPIAAASLGVWTVATGISIAGYLGVVLLLLVGVLAGSITHETWTRRLLIAAVYGGLGIFIVAVEYIAHH